MKWGLLYYKDTDNIGDDIQTYAQRQFLPQVDYLVDRESLGTFLPNEKEYVSVIMNAWYMHNKAAWPPSPYINPLLISMHFSANERLNGGDDYFAGIGAEYLKKYEPVGCRDEETIKRLGKNGISTYFSGCMTLTIKPFCNLEKKDYICAVDVNEEILQKLKESTNREIKVITHSVEPEQINKKSIDERLTDVENLLKVYQQAHLVVTSRLHTMLPCVALGTPVILVHKQNYDKDRLETFLKYVDSYVDTEFLDKDISEIIENPKENNKEYLQLANNLYRICTEFVEKNKDESLLDVEKLPNIEDYKRIVELKEYYMNLYEKAWRQSQKNIHEADEYYKKWMQTNQIKEELENKLNIQEQQIKVLNQEINGIKSELDTIRNSRVFKIAEKLTKVLKK